MVRIPIHWLIVGVSTVGLIISHGPVFAHTLGIFLKPIAAEFGWQRGEISLMIAVHGLTQAVLMPVAGRLIDKFGAHWVVTRAIIGFGCCVGGLAMLPGSLGTWYLWLMVMAVFSACVGPLPYAKVITAWFDIKRGFALGIAIAGVGIGGMIFPLVAQSLIDIGGWRFSYIGLGVIVLLIGLPVVGGLLRNTPDELGLHPDGKKLESTTLTQVRVYEGLSSAEAIKTSTFWILATGIVLVSIAIIGVLLHLSPLLTDRGMSPQTAAGVLGVLGLSSTAGRVIVGWLMDRYFAPRVAIIFFLAPALACLLLALGAVGGTGFLCAVLIGVGMGAEVDVIAYLTGRYFGTKNFTEIYGYLFAAFAIGASIGPIVMGYGFDFTGSYILPLYISIISVIVACGLFSMLGKYPD